MIRLVDADNLPATQSEHWSLTPDRPEQRKDIRKLVFFFFREGPRQTFSKVLARLNKQKHLDSSITAWRGNKLNAISYDGGRSYYISNIPKESWASPFSYDSLANPATIAGVKKTSSNKTSLYFVGYGNYAQTYTQTLRKFCQTRMFVDFNQQIIQAFKHKFDYVSHSFSELIAVWKEDSRPAAVIASYHSDHAQQAYALWSSQPEGFIFIEKPPLVDYKDIRLFREMYAAGANLQIGFNRRYSPLVNIVKDHLTPGEPVIMNISVNEVRISKNHWYFWPNQGTRITGNACHWIDLCQYYINQKPIKITITSSTVSPDDCVLVISYIDGSLAVISLTDKGNDLRGVQESIEVKQANNTYRLEDMIRLVIDQPGKSRKIHRRVIRDKGHKRMYEAFAHDVMQGTIANQYPLADLEIVSKLTYEFSKMLMDEITEHTSPMDSAQ